MTTTQPFKVVANAAFISLPSATQQGYQRDSGIFVAPDPNKRMEDNAACIGTVVAVPERLCLVLHEGEANEERIPINLKAGDKVAVDYRVISRGAWEGEVFKHENAYLINEQMVWKSEPYSLIAKWVPDGYSIDLDKIKKLCGEGSIKEFVDSLTPKTLEWYSRDSESGIAFYAGRWKALGEHVLLEKITEIDPAYQNSTLIMPEIMHKEVKGRGKHVSGLTTPRDMHAPLPIGTEVMFLPQYASTYQFTDGKEYIVIMKDYVFGVFNNTPFELMTLV